MKQPKTTRKISKEDALILARTSKIMSMVSKGIKEKADFATDLPYIIGLKLTNQCNLRCKHCYEWNEQGYHHNLSKREQNQELEIELFQKIMNETKEVKSNLYLWGGEPLVHSQFDQISHIIEKDNRITAICTNGILIDEKIDDIIRIGKNLELLIAVDGFEEDNDAMRGKGTFQKVSHNLEQLLQLRKENIFKGKISIHCVLNGDNLSKTFAFVNYFEQLGVDNVILCYPWYLSMETSLATDAYYIERFGEIPNFPPSWHAYKFQFPMDRLEELFEIRKKVLDHVWDIQVKFQPNLSDEEIVSFLKDDSNIQKNYRCYSIADRMDVLPSGEVTSCKHFSEFTVGSLYEYSVKEIWHNEKFNKIRNMIQSERLPACSKCNNLYLHGRKNK